jgi:hypothetical protein
MLVWCKESAEKFQECRKWIKRVAAQDRARARDMRRRFFEELRFLRDYACHDDEDKQAGRAKTKCLIYTDFAPLSFFFNMQIRQNDGTYKPWFPGGLIFHGTHDGGGDGGDDINAQLALEFRIKLTVG